MAGGDVAFSSLQAQEGGVSLIDIFMESLTLLLLTGWHQYSGV